MKNIHISVDKVYFFVQLPSLLTVYCCGFAAASLHISSALLQLIVHQIGLAVQRSNRFVQCAQHLRRRIQRRRQIVSCPEGRYCVRYVAVIPAGCFGEQSQQRQALGHGVNRVRAVAKTQGCARIERFEILGIDRNLAVFQLDIRRQADTFPAALLGQLELQRGDDQLVAVYQINVELPLSLP